MAAASSTASDVALKPCEIENCQRMSATLCRHCNENVCRRHFNEHADQLLQELYSLGNSINELGQNINSFCVKEYKEKAFDKLTQWRDEAIQNINDLYELKKQKFDLLLQDNEEVFSQRRTSYLEVLDTLKSETAALVKEDDVTFEQLQILKRRLNELEGNNYMREGTLLCADYQMKLNDFYGNAEQKWELIYKATRDGFRAEDFHRCCDSKGHTMTIIQSKDGNYLFGGYAKIPWDSDNKCKYDPAAFLFTLTNPYGIQPTKFIQKPYFGRSVAHSNSLGPCFGGVVRDGKQCRDFQIFTNAHKNQGSTCSFPSTYIDTTGMGEILFTGTKNFMVKEIEVYMREYEDDNEDDSEDEVEDEDEDEGDE